MIHRTLLTSTVVACLGLSAFAGAQSEAPAQDPVGKALNTWQQDHGNAWRLTRHDDLASGRHLWGFHAEAPFTPTLDEDYVELARMAFDEAFGIFNIADVTLQLEQVKHITLHRIGTTDKVAVEFRQFVNGVEVLDASAHAIFTPQGELLSLDSRCAPGVEDISTLPIAEGYAAVSAAMGEYMELELGREASEVGHPELVIVKHNPGKFMEPRLAWKVELRNRENPSNPAGREIFIAADNGSMEMLEERNLIHHQQASGTVQAYATPGTRAHSGSNPPTLHNMAHMTLTSPVGNTVTDADGNFVLNTPNNNPVNITASFNGPYCRVYNQSGADYSTSATFTPGVPGGIVMNTGQTEAVTSEASCYDSVNDFRTWLKGIDPSDNTVDFQVRTNANLNSTCNAYFDGVSINMYSSGGGCNNTGFSTVVAHEEGHWANVLYGSGNGSDGFGEGNADVFAMYIYDTPVVGQDFFTGGGFIRTGLNTRQFCGDSNGGCYGQVHTDGEVLGGAMWKVRDRLNQTLGNTAGDLTADTLLVAWMNGYNDGQIRTVIEEHLLVLDDNDGNILNGTPNFSDIDGGFRDQGFPGVDLQLIQIVHTPLGNSLSEAGPYVVSADITSLVGNIITGADVVYSVDGGVNQTVAMSNSGSTWTAGIPGQVSPARVSYHIEASDSGFNNELLPRNGEYQFVVGIENQIYFNDFEGATDEGWVHAQIATQDDWQRGTPTGSAEDPSGAYSGINCWANDLGLSGWNGTYASNTNNYLESPPIDCSGETGVTLRFARQLNVEEAIYDQARITVNGIEVFVNPLSGHLLESSWSIQEIDISAIADNNPSVVVRFSMQSDGGLEFGGWNIDDFELGSLEPVPGGGTDVIALTGDTSGNAGGVVNYTFSGMQPGESWAFLASASNAGTVIFGHTFDIGTPYNIMATGTADPAGSGSASFTIPAGLPSGAVGYMEVGATNGALIDESNLLTFTVN